MYSKSSMVNSVTHLFSEQLELAKTEHFQHSADKLSLVK